MLNIGILGISGSFHEQIARKYFPSPSNVKGYSSFEEELKLVKSGELDFAVMAIENSIAGSLSNNYHLLYENGLQIVGEQVLNIRLQLAGTHDSSLNNIIEVRSHPMALRQCENFFRDRKDIKLVEVSDTATALKEIASEGNPRIAAIGSSWGRRTYKLKKLDAEITADNYNRTRFFIVSRIGNSVGEKICLSVKLKHKTGSLALLLNEMHEFGCDLTRIESRPLKNKPFQYQFFIESKIPNYTNHIDFKNAIENLTTETKILGIYT